MLKPARWCGCSGALAIVLLTPMPAALSAQDAQVLAALRGEIGVDADAGTLLATISQLSIEKTPLGEALVRLAERSNVQIAFSSSLLPTDMGVECDCTTLSLARTLDRLLADTDLGYLELGSQVVVVPRAGGDPARQGAISGRVWSEDGVPVSGAVASLFPAADSTRVRFAQTDDLGFFTFTGLPPGPYVLSIVRIGFADHRQDVEAGAVDAAEIEIVMRTDALQLEGVVVEAQRSRTRARFEETAGITVQDIGRDELKAIPGIAESDPLRAVEVLPGVTTVSDFSAAFNVRGGSADQNLILLDDIPIYNPFHLGNLFSVFNADMVARAELRAGGFPAEYGGRVSSVLTVETDAGDGVTSVDAGVSLLASRVAVDGALPGAAEEVLGFANTRWRLSGRRSYFDVLLKPWADFPYHLSDFQGVFEGWTKGGNRIRITGYSGRDIIDLSEIDDFSLPVSWAWGNDAIGGSWVNPMRGGGSMSVRAAFSRFFSDFAFTDFEAEFDTRIQRATLQADLERRPSPGLRWKSGLAANDRDYENAARAGGTTFFGGAGSGIELTAYSQIYWEPGPRWLFEGGLRADHWRPANEQDQDAGGAGPPVSTTVSPRLAAKWFFRNRGSAVRFSAGRYSQFLHSLRDEEFPFGLDIWVLAGAEAPHVISDQAQLGVESFFGPDDAWFASLEGYYRTFNGVITQNAAEDPNDPLDDLVSGRGRAYGADLFVRRDLGRTTGWISISFLKTDRTFPDTRYGTDPPPDITYPPVFDRRLDVDLVLRRTLDWWGLEAGLRANFGTGLPYTRPLGAYEVYNPRPLDGVLDPEWESAVVLGPRNAERYPARHRLDASLRKTIVRGWGTLTPYLSVINVYNHKNVLFYFFEFDRSEPRRSGISMIPILPTIGLEVSF
ncbi:MAG: TonB-dependent receptor [Gemmatimonadetes bacterium]|nr:TonB-dependent receptor [Gemmatimonadota bacterium]MCY3678553.1 TonB-dependent receptor [Gemmatimonadota bacterium]